MEQIWKKYEALVLYNGGFDTETSEQMLERLREFIRSNGGRILKTERWGLRDMAYAIKRQKRAYYVLIEFAGPAAVSTEFARQMNLIDDIIKFQMVRLADRVEEADLPETEEEISREIPAPGSHAPRSASSEEGGKDSGDASGDSDDSDDSEDGDDSEDSDDEE